MSLVRGLQNNVYVGLINNINVVHKGWSKSNTSHRMSSPGPITNLLCVVELRTQWNMNLIFKEKR